MAKYWLQTKAKAGNWCDKLGSAHREVCIRHGRWLIEQKQAKSVRVVERVDMEVWNKDEQSD